ncbi:MAG: MucB/RseB C-terminal domain-containing protein [Methylococcaceae bacterium]
MIKRIVFTFLLTFYLVSKADTEQQAKDILMKTVHSMATLNYQGTVAFLRNGKLETMKYFHVYDHGVEQERLLSLNSPLREIVRDADKVSCLFKATKQMVVDHRPSPRSFLLDLPKNLDGLNEAYSFEIVGQEDIAMLPAFVIKIEPKDEFRYARKIWIEQKQYLPLKVEVYDVQNMTLEQVVFTDIEVKDKLALVDMDREQTLSDDTATGYVSAAPKQSPAEIAALTIGNLPIMGFREIFFTRRPLHRSDQLADHLLLSDGFASVSVYVEIKNTGVKSEQEKFDGMQSVGAVNFFSRTINDAQVTVLGDVPAKTVKAIAQAVKIKQSSP